MNQSSVLPLVSRDGWNVRPMPSPMQKVEVPSLSFDESVADHVPQAHATYTRKDILSGRGGLANKHSGNRVFRRLIKFNKDAYRNLKSKRKQNMLIESILLALERQGARFLRKEADMWVEISRKDAWTKTSQALRETDRKGDDDDSSAKSSGSKAQAAAPRPKTILLPAKPRALTWQESAPYHPSMFDYPAVSESIAQAEGDNEVVDADMEPVPLYPSQLQQQFSLGDISQSMFSGFSDVQLQRSGSLAFEPPGVFADPTRRYSQPVETARFTKEWSRPAPLAVSESLSTLPPLLRMTSSIFCRTLEDICQEDGDDSTGHSDMATV